MQASNNQPTYYVYASGASDTAGTQAVLTALTCFSKVISKDNAV